MPFYYVWEFCKIKKQSKHRRIIHHKTFEEILLQEKVILCYLLVLVIPYHGILLAKVIFKNELNIKETKFQIGKNYK